MTLSNSASSALNAFDSNVYGLALSQIVERIGEHNVSLFQPEDARQFAVQAIDIYDPASNNFGDEGVLLCLISAGAMRRSKLHSAIDSAARSHCAGIVVKSNASSQTNDHIVEIEALASEANIPVLTLAPHVNWREFDALISRSLGENARSFYLEPTSNDKLFAVANSIARVFGGSVAIEDHQRMILAHSSVEDQALDELRTTGILFRRAGDAPVNELRYRTVLAAEDAVSFPSYRSFLPRAAIAIRAGAIPLGSIWALNPGAQDSASTPSDNEHSGNEQSGNEHSKIKLSEAKLQALRDGAAAAANILLTSWSSPGREASEREASLRRLIAGVGNADDEDTLSLDIEDGFVIAAVSVPKGERFPVRMAEIRAALSRHLSAHLDRVIVTTESTEIIALCPTDSVESLHERMTDALSELSLVTSDGVRAGLSDPYPRLSQITHAVAEARSVLSNTQEDLTVGTVSRVRPQFFLDMCREQFQLDDRLVLPEIAELLQSDPVATKTFQLWFEESGNVSKVAKRLHVHEQTVRYRVRKLQSLFGEKFHSPDFRLAAWAQIRALNTDR